MRWPSLASRPARLRMAVEPTSRPTSQLTRRDTCDRVSRESCGHKRGPAGTGQGTERIDAEDDVDKQRKAEGAKADEGLEAPRPSTSPRGTERAASAAT